MTEVGHPDAGQRQWRATWPRWGGSKGRPAKIVRYHDLVPIARRLGCAITGKALHRSVTDPLRVSAAGGDAADAIDRGDFSWMSAKSQPAARRPTMFSSWSRSPRVHQ